MNEQEAKEFSARISYHNSLSALNDVDLVVEAVKEDFALKQQIFKELAKVTKQDAILATNTSSISITKIGGQIPERAHKVIGMHFMNPVPVMKLIEVIRGLQTSDETYKQVLEIGKAMNKVTTTARDSPGFIANRILLPYINEAVFVLYEGIGSVEDIDTTMRLGTNVPLGPLALADFIGLDTCLAIMRVLHTEIGESRYRPCPLLVNYVEAGWLGKKSGKGFYDYSKK
mmetsp:Transcript_6459/g.5769  ORF Transcript_6459/g.5769 Transcript_6459/m.5769 type:complete len:229 (+) Transcript_6459:223-909(+)